MLFCFSSCTSAISTLSCLRAADISELDAVNLALHLEAFFGTFAFSPVVDGKFVTQAPSQAMAEGKFNGVHVISFDI